MYPGLKPPTLIPPSHPTAMLSRLTTSNSAASRPGCSGGSAYDNFFQPIHTVSQSPSTNSISSNNAGASAIPPQGGMHQNSPSSLRHDEVREIDGETATRTPGLEMKAESKPKFGTCNSGEQVSSNDNDAAHLSNRAEEVENRRTKMERDISDNPQIHQRSRSNEIDYTSIGYDSRARSISAFRSPPGTLRTFRPQSVDSAHGSLFSDLTDSLSSAVPPSSHQKITVTVTTSVSQRSSSRNLSSSSSEATVTEVPEETVELATGQAASTEAVDGGLAGEGESADGRQPLTLEWMKNFDPGLISDYFSSSDEPRLKVPDC